MPEMLTRLKVSGFKNLVAADVRFGAFTCIAGVNGVGKSNLFDAIQFLSALADGSLMEAAQSVRAEGGRSGDVDSLFTRLRDDVIDEMSFEAEMIVPPEAMDDLGQPARATITFLRYSLTVAKRKEDSHLGPLEIVREELRHINKGEAFGHLLFPHRASSWRSSAVVGSRRAPYFISTTGDGPNRVVQIHQDSGGGGLPRSLSPVTLPRTVVSASNSAETPTALVARREMQSWRLLQLEPSTLRKPDDFRAPTQLGLKGEHLAATLFHLASTGSKPGSGSLGLTEDQVYGQVSSRLSELIEDVRDVWVDADEKRELLTLMVSAKDGTPHAARSLSDGTLRFLALTVLELDPRAQGLLCLEEPENGIHPARIPAMLRLLQDMPTDSMEAVGPDNPLRQVIINTHSPAVVAQVPDDSLLLADLHEIVLGSKRFQGVDFSCLPETWRAGESGVPIVARGELLSYLNPFMREPGRGVARRVIDREDIQSYLQSYLPFQA